MDERPTNKPGELWFELSFIMTCESQDDLEQLVRRWVELTTGLTIEQKEIVENNLRRLWDMVWQDQSMAFFTEQSSSYDRVLDIFIRANDGGTKLSRSDLLMSVITLRWEQFNAREETAELLDKLNDLLQAKRAAHREFLLRTALYLNDLHFSIQVKNFTPSNINKLENTWEEVKDSLLFTANWLREVGLYGEALSGINVLMFMAYYFKHSGIARGDRHLTAENSELIRQWIITVQFQRLLGTQTNQTLSAFRNEIRRAPRDSDLFPIQAASNAFTKRGRHVVGFSSEWANKYCDQEMHDSMSEKLLSLLYKQDLAASGLRPLPLVQPRYFLPEELRRAGLPENIHQHLQEHANKLGLAIALTEEEEADYYAMPFNQWVQTLTPEQIKRHHLPQDVHHFSVANLPELIKERRSKVTSYLRGVMPEAIAE